MAKAPHHSGTYLLDARRLRAAATANPATTCWRCGLTLKQHAPHHNGKPATWTAGHVIDGQGHMLPEASTCNYAASARRTNALRRRTDLTW